MVAAIVAGVMNLPTAMLPEEQVGWMFHRVCMKEASTWQLPLAMERCCKTEASYTGLQTEGLDTATKVVVLARGKHRQTVRFSITAQRREMSQCWD